MDFKNFTTLAQEAIQQASQLAIKYDAPELTPFHLLEALVGQIDSPVKNILKHILAQGTGDFAAVANSIRDVNLNQPKIQ